MTVEARSPRSGKQVLLYLVDGQPNGLRTAEIANWTGHVVAAPRAELARLLSRDEPKRTGVYLLIGDDPQAAQPGGATVYVGEGDEVATRLRNHQQNKDWWDRVVIVTSQAQAQQLTKSQVRYLESELITRAKASSRAVLDNETDPGFARLSEAERSNMDYFLDQLHVLLPAIGVDVFRSAAVRTVVNAPVRSAAPSPEFFLTVASRGLSATAQVVDGEFVVLSGSTAAPSVASSTSYSDATARAYANLGRIHSGLVENGSLVLEGATTRFVKNVPFTSPSTAGAIVLGRSCNGRISWLTADGMQFGKWEARDLDAPDSAGVRTV